MNIEKEEYKFMYMIKQQFLLFGELWA